MSERKPFSNDTILFGRLEEITMDAEGQIHIIVSKESHPEISATLVKYVRDMHLHKNVRIKIGKLIQGV